MCPQSTVFRARTVFECRKRGRRAIRPDFYLQNPSRRTPQAGFGRGFARASNSKKLSGYQIALPFFCLFSFLFPCQGWTANRVTVEFFFVPGCEACGSIERELLPELAHLCPGRYTLVPLDLNEETNYFRLVVIQERHGHLVNEPVYMAVEGKVLLSGLAQIRTGLVAAVAAAIPEARLSKRAETGVSQELLNARMARFKAIGVFLAGLADGLNPCAIASLVFLLGLLASSRVKGRVLALAGALFCLSSFLTYFMLGLGLLESLRALSALAGLRLWLNRVLAVVLLVMAFLSFRDAWRFRKGGEAKDLSLKLPEFLRERIKRLAKREIQTQPIAWAALVLGCLVTLIESVCTGQLYVPTLAWVAKETQELGGACHGEALRSRALGLLGLYNLGFIIPLAGVFGAVLGGKSVFDLLGWQQKNVVRAKIVLGLVFLALAVGLAMRW